jgi:phospholipid transport system substrate-binding protein
MFFRKPLTFVIFLIIFFSNINKVYSIEADVFVQSTVNRASKLLSENITKEQKIEELKVIAKETVDIIGIGFYSLGAKRKELSDDEEKKYFILFEKYFLISFSSRLSEYTNPEIDVNNKEVLNSN